MISDTPSSSPLCRHESRLVMLPLTYGGSIDHYCAAAAAAASAVDCRGRYNKRLKDSHRMTICDTHGLMRLTVPITLPQLAPGAPMRWQDVEVSAHGRWWNVHLTTLESAYGRTPFFPFYIDRFAPLFTSRYETERVKLWQLDKAISDAVCDILGIPRVGYLVGDDHTPEGLEIALYDDVEPPRQVEYYQVRAHRHGFLPSLSILDLIFNMGPEAPLVINRMLHRDI